MRLYEQIMARPAASVARPAARPAPWQDVLPTNPLRAARLRRRRGAAALRRRARSRATACCRNISPSRSASCSSSSSGLAPAVRRCTGQRARDHRAARASRRALEASSAREQLRAVLHAGDQPVPAPRRPHPPDRGRERVPRRARPHAAAGLRDPLGHRGRRLRHRAESEAAVPAVLRRQRPGRPSSDGAPTTRSARTPRVLSARTSAAAGPRSSYVGSEVFICAGRSATRGPYQHRACASSASRRLCTNRDLPLHMPVGKGTTDFTLESGAPVESMRCLAGPTPPRASHARRRHRLAADQPSVAQLPVARRQRRAARGGGAARAADAVRRPGDAHDAQADRGGARRSRRRRSRARCRCRARSTFGRGLEITVTCDEAAFEGTRRLPARGGAGALLRQIRLDQFVHRDGSAHRAARRDHAMAGQNRAPADNLAAVALARLSRGRAPAAVAAPIIRRCAWSRP